LERRSSTFIILMVLSALLRSNTIQKSSVFSRA
jgi:hypothetical protein